MKKIIPTLAAATLMVLAVSACSGGGDRPSAAAPVDPVAQNADDYRKGMLATQELLIGSQGERSQAVYQPFFTNIHSEATAYAAALMFDKPNQLWPDLPQFPNGKAVMYSVQRLRTMAQAYVTPGPLYLNETLLQKVRQALDVLITRYYHEGVAITSWYEYQIAGPQELMSIISIMDSYLSPELKDRMVQSSRHYLSTIEVNQTQPTSPQTSANRVDLAWAMLVRGFVTRNDGDINEAKQVFFDSRKDRFAALKNALPYASGAFRLSSVDGIRSDGGYVFHGDIPYANGYGLDLLNRAPEMLLLLNATSFDFPVAQKDAILGEAFEQLSKTWLPWLRDGVGLDSVAGRAVFRGFEQDHGKGHWALEGLTKFYKLADLGSDIAVNRQRKAMVGQFIKSFITNERNYYARYGANDDAVAQHDFRHYATRALSIKVANNIMADGAIPYVKESLPGTYIFAESDRFVHRTASYAFAISGHSYRTGNFEIIAGEGAKSCYSADGMNYFHDDDLDQYMDYWAVYDGNRPAGVTNDATSPKDENQCSWSANAPDRIRKGGLRWAGGVAAGTDSIGTYGMDYKDWHWTKAVGSNSRVETPFVEAKKSWFAFGEVILALGSDIKCNAGCDRSKLATTLDNRKLNGTASNAVLVNGDAWQGQASVFGVSSVHISGNTDASTLGIVLPVVRKVSFIKEARTGDWLTMSERASFLMKGTAVKGNFLQTSFSHADANDSSYAYILLPGKTSFQTSAYAANQTIKVLSNTPAVHAAFDQATRAYAMNVFASPSKGYITASSTLLRNRFTAAGNVNTPLAGGEADQLFSAAAAEQLYGVDGQVKTTGGVSLMTRLDGDELTVWVSQPSREVMSALLDVRTTGFTLASVLEGSQHVSVDSTGSKAVVRADLDYIGQRTLAFAWDGSGQTYKLRFKIKR